MPLDQFVEKCERNYIVTALKITKGNVTHAAKILEATHRTLCRKIAKHNIKPELYREKNQEYQRIRARQKLAYAVKAGQILKPKRCEKCNEIHSLEGHHTDYSKPLAVIWLCKSCHEHTHMT